MKSSSVLPLALAAVLLAAATFPVPAAELRWSSKPFQVLANEKRLVDFLRELAASQGTTAVIDPKVDGLISGKFVISGRSNGSARQILDGVCASYGLTYYYDGALLFIEPASEARSEVLPISGSNAARITDAIMRMQLSDKRFPLTINAADNHVFVSGPKRYVEAVRQVVKSIDYRASQVDKAEVKLFPLKYAWAADFTIRRSGREVNVPGVVSVLRSLYDPKAGANGNGGPNGAVVGGASAMPRVTGNRQIRLPSGSNVAAPKVDANVMASAEDGDAGNALPVLRHDLPQFHIDTRMNAVLVRDLPERMPRYAELIASMDMKPRLVEIEVTIMDISNETLQDLGVDWRIHGKHGDFQTGDGRNAPLTWANGATVAGQTGATVPLGGVFTANIGSELKDFLLARVSALAAEGQANFVARPKVLTLDNTEASLENKAEFYIKVPGFQDSSLYTVIAGTDVRVTPLVIDEPGGRGVMMTININDDSVTSETVDDLPIVRRRSVITQAMVGDGQGILLAGYSSEERTNTMSGVPGLSKIPYVGNLFKYQSKKQSNMERFYLLTPRFVMPGVAMQVPSAPPPTPLPAPQAPFESGGRS